MVHYETVRCQFDKDFGLHSGLLFYLFEDYFITVSRDECTFSLNSFYIPGIQTMLLMAIRLKLSNKNIHL